MKQKSLLFAILIAVLTVSISCTPQVAPIPAQAPATPQKATPPSIAAPIVPAISPEESAWASVVKQAQKEGKLTVYSSAFFGDIGTGLRAAFKERYGINMDIIIGAGAQTNERLRTEQRVGSFTGDLLEGGGIILTAFKSFGLADSSKDIPVLREKGVWRVDPPILDDISEARLLVHRLISLPLYVNTDVVKKGQEPKAWKELIEPQWKGKIMLPDPRLTAGAYTSLLGLQLHNVVPLEFVKALGNQDLKFGSSQREVATSLTRGDTALAFGLTEGDTFAFLQQGAHIQALNTAEGNSMQQSAVSVIKNAPHPNAAKLFANWILTQEGQTLFARLAGLASVRLDGGDFRHERAKVTTKQTVLTGGDGTKLNQLFLDKYLIDLWKK